MPQPNKLNFEEDLNLFGPASILKGLRISETKPNNEQETKLDNQPLSTTIQDSKLDNLPERVSLATNPRKFSKQPERQLNYQSERLSSPNKSNRVKNGVE